MVSRLRPQDLPVSYALAEPHTTSLGRLFAPYSEKHAGKSGFAIVASGREAFIARYALTTLAEKTIDAQYYIWEEDTTGRILLFALMKAASRGVRVRLLLDDMNTTGKDHALAILAAHPNIQVRLYNPFAGRSFRGWDMLFNFARITHHMHNKAFIVDNVVAIVGGRNIGDTYFSAHEQSNFRDLDLFAGGPIVNEVSESFDAFWNSTWALPAHAFVNEQPPPEQFHQLAAALDPAIADYEQLPFPLEFDPETLIALAKNIPSRLIWGKGTVLADRPDKPQTAESDVFSGLRLKLDRTLNRELLLEVAYFVPGARALALSEALTV
jgi:putative cardiolipin synthase